MTWFQSLYYSADDFGMTTDWAEYVSGGTAAWYTVSRRWQRKGEREAKREREGVRSGRERGREGV